MFVRSACILSLAIFAGIAHGDTERPSHGGRSVDQTLQDRNMVDGGQELQIGAFSKTADGYILSLDFSQYQRRQISWCVHRGHLEVTVDSDNVENHTNERSAAKYLYQLPLEVSVFQLQAKWMNHNVLKIIVPILDIVASSQEGVD